MTYGLRVAPRARDQITQAAAWWLENRPAAPTAFADELARALQLIRDMPDAGQPAADPNREGLRRVLLRRVRYHLYYVASHDDELVIVLALWHASRGTEPVL